MNRFAATPLPRGVRLHEAVPQHPPRLFPVFHRPFPRQAAAAHHAEETLLRLYFPVRIVAGAFSPLVRLLDGLGHSLAHAADLVLAP